TAPSAGASRCPTVRVSALRASRRLRHVPQRATGLTGAAGEYYVAAELSRRGWPATATITNAPGTDVLAQDPETKRTVAIQTKTSSGGIKFTLGERDERTYPQDPGWVVVVGLAG